MPRPPHPSRPRRRTRHAAWIAIACGVATLPCAPTMAQPTPTPIEAAQLQTQLRAWFASILAPAVTLAEPRLTVTSDGDKYLLSLPASPWAGPAADDVTAELRHVEGGMWTLDRLNAPLKGAVTTDPPAAMALDYEIAELSLRATIDPEMRRRSTMAFEARELMMDIRVEGQKQVQRIDRYAVHSSVVPTADGRFDLSQDTTVSDWTTTAEVTAGTSIEMAIRRARIAMRIEGIRSDRLGSVFTTLKELVAIALNDQAGVAAIDKGPAPLPPDPLQLGRRKARLLIEAFRDIAQRIEAEETVDDLTITMPTIGKLSLTEIQFGMGAEAPDGRLRAWTELSMRGFETDAIPPNLRDYVPSRIALRPTISGVQTDRIFNLLLRAIEDNPDTAALEAETMALLTSADTVIGIEALAIDLDPLRLSGSGRLRVFGKDSAGIEARLSATGFDALMAQVNQNPELRQATPLLLMARGLGRQEGDRLVWDLALTQGQMLVNGVDVLSMRPPDAPPQPQPGPNRR